MTAADVLDELEAAGFRLEVRERRLFVSPSSLLTDDLRARVKQHRDDLVWLVEHLRRVPDIHEVFDEKEPA